MPKRKLADLLGQAPVSVRGLSRVVAACQADQVQVASRHAIGRALVASVDVDTLCGKLLRVVPLPMLANAEPFSWTALVEYVGSWLHGVAHKRP